MKCHNFIFRAGHNLWCCNLQRKTFLRNEVMNYSNSQCCFEAVTTNVPELLQCKQDRCSGAAMAVTCLNRGACVHKEGR
jgi:hypothetical protein